MHFHYIHPFAVFISVLQSWAETGGYAFLFGISVLEALPLIGSVIPGHSAVLIGGFLAQLGVLQFWWVVFYAALGAILGDLVAFYIGKKYGVALLLRFKRHFFFKESYLERTRALVNAHSGKAIILGRFNPITRGLVPFVVGTTSDVSMTKFWICNIVAGLTWAVLSVFIGYTFGYGYHAAAGIFGKAVMWVTVIAILSIWGYHFVNMRFHIFRKYELFVLILALGSLLVLFETIQDAWALHSYLANFDVAVNVFMVRASGTVLTTIAEWISTIADMTITAFCAYAVAVWFLFRRKWRSGFIALCGMLLTGFGVGSLKAYFLRVRPTDAFVLLSDPSFPSGHAAFAAALCLILIYLFTPRFQSWIKRELFIVLCVLGAFLVGLSRLVLNVHWASDVIAGWSLGFFCVSVTILMVRYIGALIVKRIEA